MILSTVVEYFFSSIFGLQGGIGTTSNDLIIKWRSIWLFRYHEHQNLSIISEDIGRVRMVQQFWNGTEERSTVVLEDRIQHYKLSGRTTHYIKG